jgi:ATP-dependent 26S proteasome regulatory subunit
MAISQPDEKQWAIERRIGDVFAKLGEKFGDLSGRIDVSIRPQVSFDAIGGLDEAKNTIQGFARALTNPELYQYWGIRPPKGLLLYGPPGTGKTLLARALATASEAVFYHLKLVNLTSKVGPNTGDLIREILGIAVAEGKAVLFLDEADALSLEHLLPPPQAREASARLVAAVCEKLDSLDESARVLVVASTSRTDSIDPSLVAPGHLDHLIEIPLPDTLAQRQILDIVQRRTEADAGRRLYEPLDYSAIVPAMGGMSGADISQIVRRALEGKVHKAASGKDATPVTSEDLLLAIDTYKRVRGVVEKIRYGQYL